MAAVDRRFSWGHININVRNLDRSVAFYRKFGFEVFIPGIPYLGLEQEGGGEAVSADAAAALGLPAGSRGRACIMSLDEGFPKLDLTEYDGDHGRDPLANGDVGLVRICLVTEDLQAEVERLREEGVSFISDPVSGHGELADVAVCRDPDGALIELLQVYLDRWASILE